MTAAVLESRVDAYRSEYAHQRSFGISRARALDYLADAYRVAPSYLANVCKDPS